MHGRGGLVGVLLLGALVACAEPGATPSGSSTSTVDVPRASLQAEVVALRAGAEDTRLVATVLVAAGSPGCAEDLRASVEREGDVLHVSTVYDSSTMSADPADPPPCPSTEEREVVLEVPPLDGLRLQLNGTQEWGPAGADVLRRCEPPFGCDPPPADHCDAAYLSALTTQDMLPNARSTVLSCDQEWLVVDVGSTPDGCAPPDGAPAPSGCADAGREVRWFAQFDDGLPGWQVVVAGRAAGCADVEAAGVDLPVALCTGLPAR